MKIQEIIPEEKLDSILVSLFGENVRSVISSWNYFKKLGAVLNTWYSGYDVSLVQLIRNPDVKEVTSLKEMDQEGFYVVKDMSVIFEPEPVKVIFLCPVHHVKLKPRGLQCPVCGDAWKKRGLRKEAREVYQGIIMDKEDNKMEAIYIGKELPRGWVLGATLDALVYLRVVWWKTNTGFESEKLVEILEVVRTEPLIKDIVSLKPAEETVPSGEELVAELAGGTGVLLSEEEEQTEEAVEKPETPTKQEEKEEQHGEKEPGVSRKDLIKNIKGDIEGALIMGKKICIDMLAEKYGVSEQEVEKIVVEVLGYELDEEGCVV